MEVGDGFECYWVLYHRDGAPDRGGLLHSLHREDRKAGHRVRVRGVRPGRVGLSAGVRRRGCFGHRAGPGQELPLFRQVGGLLSEQALPELRPEGRRRQYFMGVLGYQGAQAALPGDGRDHRPEDVHQLADELQLQAGDLAR